MSFIKVKFNTLLLVGKIVAKDLAQCDKFFMVCILATMSSNIAYVQVQILLSLTIPTLQAVFSCFLRVTFVPLIGVIVGDSFTLVSSHV